MLHPYSCIGSVLPHCTECATKLPPLQLQQLQSAAKPPLRRRVCWGWLTVPAYVAVGRREAGAYLCICTDCGAEDQNPGTAKTMAPPFEQSVLAPQMLHCTSVGSNEYSPDGQRLQVSSRPPVTCPFGHLMMVTVRFALAQPHSLQPPKNTNLY